MLGVLISTTTLELHLSLAVSNSQLFIPAIINDYFSYAASYEFAYATEILLAVTNSLFYHSTLFFLSLNLCIFILIIYLFDFVFSRTMFQRESVFVVIL